MEEHLKTIAEILDSPATEKLIAEKVEMLKGGKTWTYLSRRDMLAPTSITYQYRRQQAHESSMPSWVRLDIHIIVSEAVEEMIKKEII